MARVPPRAVLIGFAIIALAGGAPAEASTWRQIEDGELERPAGAFSRWGSVVLRGGEPARAPVWMREVDRISVRARGRGCAGRPILRVTLDGRPVLKESLGAGGFRTITRDARIGPGRRALAVALVNPRREGRCRRELHVAWIGFRERVPVGTAVDALTAEHDPIYRSAAIERFDSITPENDMKWSVLQPTPERIEFSRADGLVRMARDRGRAVHGHALVFDSALPGWLTANGGRTRAELANLLSSYIKAVVGHYRGSVHSWDVVNEPLGTGGGLARTYFMRHLGPSYVDLALRAAHEADPTARLYINEVGAETIGPKSNGLLQLARNLLANGAPLHGIGFQTHTALGIAPDRGALSSNLKRFADLGLEVAISEMDVRTSTAPNPDQALEDQGRVYRDVAQACADQPACQRFSVWGVSDRHSWLGLHERGLLLDGDFLPKPAWLAVQAVLRG